MSIVGHGIDLVECSRIASVMQRHPQQFWDRILTETEQTTARRFADPVPHISGRFAAKEAILKLLGTGWRGRIRWRDIEIVNDANGQPCVTLSGECARVAQNRGIARVLLSITHIKDHAAASAIGLSEAT